MDNLTLRQLRYFEALARHAHFGHAADACSISQPALSMQIKEMEQTLGAALFERTSRRIRLTSFGAQMAPRVRDILQSVDELGDLARTNANAFSGRLRIGVIPTIAPYLLPSIIGHLSAAHPEMDLHIRETLTPKLIEELADGRIDTALVALPISEPSFEEVALFEESFVLVRPQSEGGQPVPDADTLREMRLLLLEEGHCFRDQALSFCNLRSTLPRESLDGSSLATLVQMVGAGIGVTLIPEMAVGVETSSAAVAVSEFPAPRPSRQIGMIWRRSNPLANQLRQISKVVQTAAHARTKTWRPRQDSNLQPAP